MKRNTSLQTGEPPRAEIITVGNEVLSGRTVNTNAAFVASELERVGVSVAWVTTVGDVAAHIRDAFLRAWERANVVIVTGGLGPTHDDVTRSVFCEVFARGLRRDEAVLQNIRSLFAARGRPVTPRNEEQALVPEGTEVVQNRWGTAPGIHWTENGKHWFLLPGVPREMQNLLTHEVLPRLRGLPGARTVVRRELHVVGVPESYLMDRIADITGIEQVASLPDSKGEVCLRVTVASESYDEAHARCARIVSDLEARLGDAIYGYDGDTLEAVVGRLLAERNMTIAVAESCTGGLVTSRLTDVPGSSRYLVSAVVAYANAAKTDFLGVPLSTLAAHGAVSAETAAAMASGIRNRSQADLGVAVTGIAGPGGGSPEKPVGLVYLAVADREGIEVVRELFGDDRLLTKARTAEAALALVRKRLLRKMGNAVTHVNPKNREGNRAT
ncbi:MAG TPA: competence/damage-inducible protein A [Candidatus Latescibacteria bacterium]|nr:competence/damage-inducible protein A [Candidatus Latescibacterota bacterium]